MSMNSNRQLATNSKRMRYRALRLSLYAAGTMSALAAGAHDAAPSASMRPLAVPIPLLEVMRAAVEIPADGIWAAQSAETLSDKDWLLVDQDSVALASAATLISIGGNGKTDRQWVANQDWQAWARDVQKTALAVRRAGKTKNVEQLNITADHLTEVCQSCHAKYRPETPSDGIARYPFYPKRIAAP